MRPVFLLLVFTYGASPAASLRRRPPAPPSRPNALHSTADAQWNTLEDYCLVDAVERCVSPAEAFCDEAHFVRSSPRLTRRLRRWRWMFCADVNGNRPKFAENSLETLIRVEEVLSRTS
eukprot:scaffold301_cov243-Pinguiococcus_pyrenoidosus.AAC.103